MSPVFKGKNGKSFAEHLLHLFSMDRLNAVYDRRAYLQGPDFAAAILEDQAINYQIGGADMLEKLPKGPFITISNHPYGSIDGIILIDLFGHIRPDYKVMVNKVLSCIKTLGPNFINVIPTGEKKTAPASDSILGVKHTLTHLRDGSPMGFFPSGAVSDLSLKDFKIHDREWQKPVLRLIKAARVPILPVHFLDRNSNFYYLLGLISWKIRLLRLPGEVLNKGGKDVRLTLGPIISEEDQDRYKNIDDFGSLLRRSVYGMPVTDSFKMRSEISFPVQK